jgi:hypothetical protein
VLSKLSVTSPPSAVGGDFDAAVRLMKLPLPTVISGSFRGITASDPTVSASNLAAEVSDVTVSAAAWDGVPAAAVSSRGCGPAHPETARDRITLCKTPLLTALTTPYSLLLPAYAYYGLQQPIM